MTEVLNKDIALQGNSCHLLIKETVGENIIYVVSQSLTDGDSLGAICS